MDRTKRTRRVVLRTTDHPQPAPRLPAVPIVVEVFADGFVQVFGPDHVRPVVVVHFADDGGPDLHTLIEEYHGLELPPTHRHIYQPRHIRAMSNVRQRTIEGEAKRRWDLAFLRGLREAGEVLRREHS